MIPSTVRRVPENTAPLINTFIRQRTEENVARVTAAGPEAVATRLVQLDREWDTERVITAASGVFLVGFMLSAVVYNRWWNLASAGVAVSLLLHAFVGWSPLLPVVRWFGVRTLSEIDYERYSLKALRGDFSQVPVGSAVDAFTAGRVVQTVAE